MDGNHTAHFFLEPKEVLHRQYEALRAIFVESVPVDEAAARFGYAASALKSMASRFRATCGRGIAPPFFAPMGGDDLLVPIPAHFNRAPIHLASVIAGN